MFEPTQPAYAKLPTRAGSVVGETDAVLVVEDSVRLADSVVGAEMPDEEEDDAAGMILLEVEELAVSDD